MARIMVEKKMFFICNGSVCGRELYSPDCDVSRMIFALERGVAKRKNFVFVDLLTFHQFGWEIHYKGKMSDDLKRINAKYHGEEIEEEE